MNITLPPELESRVRERIERGDYDKLYAALRHWLANEFPFWRPYYSNREIPPEAPT